MAALRELAKKAWQAKTASAEIQLNPHLTSTELLESSCEKQIQNEPDNATEPGGV